MKSPEKTKEVHTAMIIGSIAAITFIGIAIYILFLLPPPLSRSNNDLRLYAMLTGTYGLWRAIRVFLLWKKAQPFTVSKYHKEAP